MVNITGISEGRTYLEEEEGVIPIVLRYVAVIPPSVQLRASLYPANYWCGVVPKNALGEWLLVFSSEDSGLLFSFTLEGLNEDDDETEVLQDCMAMLRSWERAAFLMESPSVMYESCLCLNDAAVNEDVANEVDMLAAAIYPKLERDWRKRYRNEWDEIIDEILGLD